MRKRHYIKNARSYSDDKPFVLSVITAFLLQFLIIEMIRETVDPK